MYSAYNHRTSARQYDQPLTTPELNLQTLDAVSQEEIGYALSLFLCAANGQLPPNPKPSGRAQLLDLKHCRSLYLALTGPAEATTPAAATEPRHPRTLEAAFASLWHSYAGDARRSSICARVLAFYLLMERTEGSAIAAWAQPSDSDSTEVVLHPAVVQALAVAPLDAAGLQEDTFVSLIGSIASRETANAVA